LNLVLHFLDDGALERSQRDFLDDGALERSQRDFLDDGALERSQRHFLDDGALERSQRWLGAPTLEDALGDLRRALRTVPFGEPVQWAGSICVLAGCAALAADQGDDARLSKCSGAAVRLAVDLLSKRELARLFAEIPDPEPGLELDELCPCPCPDLPSLDELDFDAIPLDAFHGLAVRFGCGPGC
jgi:hypothetical protein